METPNLGTQIPGHLGTQPYTHWGTCLSIWAPTEVPAHLSTCLFKPWCRSRWKLQIWVPRYLGTQVPNQSPTGAPTGVPGHPLMYLHNCLHVYWNPGVDLDWNSKSGYPGTWAPRYPTSHLLGHLRGLLVAVGWCNTWVRLSLIYVPGQPPRPPVPGILWGMSYVRSHISKMHV